MKFWKGSKIGIVLGILVGCLLAVGLVYAWQYALDIPGSVVVEEGYLDLELYEDWVGNHKITSIDWGTIKQGHTLEKTVHIKNLGSETVTVHLRVSGPSGFDWNPDAYSGQVITPGELGSFLVWIRAHSDISPGSYNFVYTFGVPLE